jgi:hypothetical protein
LVISRGTLKLVGGSAFAHQAPRPIHAEVRPGEARDRAKVADDRAFARNHEHDFHTRDVRAFTGRELAVWQSGLWRNEWHYGRRGWWWETDGVWYGYPDPIYPYPLEVATLEVYDTATVDGPDVEAYEPPASDQASVPNVAPPDAAAPGSPPPVNAPPAYAEVLPLPAPPAGWYRCPTPGGYYPSIGLCASTWALVQEPPPPPPSGN